MPTPKPSFLPPGRLSLEACRVFLREALTPVTTSQAQCTTETHWLLEKATGMSPSAWLANPRTLLSTQAREQLDHWLHQRVVDRCPIQYLLGEAHFFGLTFAVSPAVLIPRPETELLVEAAVAEALHRLKHSTGTLRIVDVGTGSGCIPIAIGHTLRSQLSNKDWKRIEVLAVDCSSEALAVATQNATKHAIPITFYQGSWLQPLLAGKLTVEMIISNPPYIPSAVCNELAPEVIGHEPRLALDGGPDGLQPYRELFAQAKGCLTPNGWISCEFGGYQASLITTLLHSFGFQSVYVQQDLAGVERLVTARQS
ncbi:MAG: peptide chain release factor N(5)-glutamine methyltransferase [Vampirovibrionales bacterium]|nr:peptide chain release factor N(5)-glutamine methyltransferase [Vampirovibrionales bacterium]